MNRVTLCGNVGRDPEVRTTQDGTRVANVSLATNDRWRDRHTGERRERTEWHKLVFYGKVAEIVEKHVRRGSKLLIEGKLQTREWEDREGTKHWTTEVVVTGFAGSIEMLGDRRDSGGHRGGDHDYDSGAGGGFGAGSGNPLPDGYLDDGIPF